MTFSLIQSNTIFTLSLAALLVGCGSVRMQSFDQFSKQTTQSTYRSDRQECARYTDSGDYRQCVKRTDEVYEQLRNEREKAARP
ncbi:hypothetical protein [Massilia sp. S19_KUP03_FR1]|uniref:hypothetical protein n=1 Tax=Massilia sp. S19_KUP03_FR1 TaxID=3025503 RepID=UPI002FCD71C9